MRVGDLVWVYSWEELAIITESDNEAGLYTVMFACGDYDEIWDFEIDNNLDNL